MSRGEHRNAGLSQAAMTAAAGSGLIGLVQGSMAPSMTAPWTVAATAAGVVLVVLGVGLAIRSLMRRPRGPGQ